MMNSQIRSLFLILVLVCQALGSFLPIKSRFGGQQMPVGKPIKGKPISLCDGDVVAGKICVYKCKICDMPRLFVMNYGSHIGLAHPKKFTLSGLWHKNGKPFTAKRRSLFVNSLRK